LRQSDKFLDTGPHGAFRHLIAHPPLFTLPVTFFRGTLLLCQRESSKNYIISKTSVLEKLSLFEIRGAAFEPFAFFALGDILYLAALKQGFHLDFAPAGAKKLLRRA
jgi:hypothetical protein